MSEAKLPTIHQDSSALWGQISGVIDRSFQGVLMKLDEYQAKEDISPDLAETVRDAFFQLSQENPQRLNALTMRSMTSEGPLLKFILTQLEDGGGDYRIMKSAQLIEKRTGKKADDIRTEYMSWQQQQT